MFWDTGDVITSIMLTRSSYVFRIAYASFSLGYGKGIPPLGLPGGSKPSYRRRRIVPGCDRNFLLDVWTEVNLADSSENRRQ